MSLSPHLTLHNAARAEAYLRTKCHLDPSSHLATIDMADNGGFAPFGGRGWDLQCGLSRGLPPYQMASRSIKPDMGQNWGGCALFEGGELGPYLTMWSGPRPTFVPSFILIHRNVWPQYTNVTDRQTGQAGQRDRQDNGPI